MRCVAVLVLFFSAYVWAGAETPNHLGVQDVHTLQTRASRKALRADRFHSQCWDTPGMDNTSFLEVDTAQSGDKAKELGQVKAMCAAAKEYEAQSATSVLTDEQRRGCEAIINVASPDMFNGYDANLYGPLWNMFPKMAGALFGRSVFSGCKCEACVYSLDTLIMYLDEDTLGFFNENDINRVLMDRFCYGLKWMYRSACHHIMSDYYPQVVDMLQKYLTGWDVCRHLRFCPWSLTAQTPS